MPKILIYCPNISGHRLEYLHHMYSKAINTPENEYYIIVDSAFKNISTIFSWPVSSNVSIEFIPESQKRNSHNILTLSFSRCKGLKKYVDKISPEIIYVMDMIEYIPALPIIFNKKVKVRGIIYRIYLYDWKYESLFKRLLDVVKYFILSRFPQYETVYILNDSSSTSFFNRKYRTSKFKYLPDPVAFKRIESQTDVYFKYKIPKERMIVLHLGSMQPYKGTLNILRAIEQLDELTLSRYTFVFAGKVNKSIKSEFYKCVVNFKSKAHIIVDDDFISFEKMSDFIESCEFILIPYNIKSQSSGIIGHANLYEKPVVAVDHSLIGKLVKRNRMGYLLDSPSIEDIISFLKDYKSENYELGKSYIDKNTIESFVNHLEI